MPMAARGELKPGSAQRSLCGTRCTRPIVYVRSLLRYGIGNQHAVPALAAFATHVNVFNLSLKWINVKTNKQGDYVATS
jgi:hypothetical protein